MATAGWRIALASATGTSHDATGAPCQDYADVRVLGLGEDSTIVAVVCDGAGSAQYSDIGAKTAATALIEHVEMFLEGGSSIEALSREEVSGWIEQIAATLEGIATTEGHAVRDYACTLLAAVVGTTHSAFVQIGDGAIVVSEGIEDGWAYVFWPQHGEFANTTNFIVSANALDVMEFAVGPSRPVEFAVFSDGIENLVLHHATKSVHEPFFESMFRPMRQLATPGVCDRLSKALETYLRSPAVCERTDDDKTLILASRVVRPGGPSGQP